MKNKRERQPMTSRICFTMLFFLAAFTVCNVVCSIPAAANSQKTYIVTVTGTSGKLTRTTTFRLRVVQP